VLEVRGVSKSFGGVRAVADASLEVRSGEIVALIGPNGAGKTTLFAAIAGFVRPEAGRIMFEGAEITGLEPHTICGRGLVRTFQIVQPFAGLSVRENIAIGAHLRIAEREAALAKANEVAALFGMASRLDQPAESLTVAGRKRLELARALATGPKLLMLDEVMAGLIPTEIDEIVPVIRRIRDSGVTILMIEHVMRAVASLAERAYVLNQGAIIASGTPAAISSDTKVIEAYLGHGAAERLRAQMEAGRG